MNKKSIVVFLSVAVVIIILTVIGYILFLRDKKDLSINAPSTALSVNNFSSQPGDVYDRHGGYIWDKNLNVDSSGQKFVDATLKVIFLKDNKVQVLGEAFEGNIEEGPNYGSVGTGPDNSFPVILDLVNNKAEFSNQEDGINCVVDFNFGKDNIIVEDKNPPDSCWGHNVTFSGVYIKEK